MTSGFAHLQRFLRETSGANIEEGKRYLLEATLKPLLQAQAVADLDELAKSLQSHRQSELARMVMETMTINETSFFRDKALFQALSSRLLPAIASQKAAGVPLRIWCAGCASGQEPYSIAIAIDDNARSCAPINVEIVATDLSRAVIEKAQQGRYSQFEVQRGLPIGLLLRHFQQCGSDWQISDAMRGKVRFSWQNLLEIPSSFGTFDVVFCRNVLFYFDEATKEAVVSKFAEHTTAGGLLVLGAAERLSSKSQIFFEKSKDEPFLYQRRPAQPKA